MRHERFDAITDIDRLACRYRRRIAEKTEAARKALFVVERDDALWWVSFYQGLLRKIGHA